VAGRFALVRIDTSFSCCSGDLVRPEDRYSGNYAGYPLLARQREPGGIVHRSTGPPVHRPTGPVGAVTSRWSPPAVVVVMMMRPMPEQQRIECVSDSVHQCHVFHLRSTESVGKTLYPLITLRSWSATICHGTLSALQWIGNALSGTTV
jgi:hypothetical protein